ncbi:hypothetical protein [Litchfieldia alkalitelluris]|uniref:hypothetical protein n=1 Tax=Litchfieldia alkalitelluris TaxID=304268 RepID=UPI000996D8B5|nr:hypothetical protein [Litchfieldia alkalitelluris]
MNIIFGYIGVAVLIFIFMELTFDESVPTAVSSSEKEEIESSIENKPEPIVLESKQITLKSGMGDPVDVIKNQGKTEGYSYSQAKLIGPDFKFQCGRFNETCTDLTIYFTKEVTSPEEAFELVKDHLPTDLEILGTESKKDGTVIVYNLKSESLYEVLEPLYKMDGIEEATFHLSLRYNSDEKIFAAVAKIGEEKFFND